MTNEIHDWQLDAIDAVMRRCDVLSDFSSDTFARTLEQMGFTIVRRVPLSAADRARQNRERAERRYCGADVKHTGHFWDAYRAYCSGKPMIQNHGYGTGKTWAGIRVGEPIMDEVPATFTGHAETDRRNTEERTTQNLADPFTITPLGSVWVRRNKSHDDDMEGLIHDRATVVETYYKMRIDNNGRGRQFYVRYVDEDGEPHVRTQNGFVAVWEREKES